VNSQRGFPPQIYNGLAAAALINGGRCQSLIEDSPPQAAENALTFAVQNLLNKSHGSIYVKI